MNLKKILVLILCFIQFGLISILNKEEEVIVIENVNNEIKQENNQNNSQSAMEFILLKLFKFALTILVLDVVVCFVIKIIIRHFV